MNVLQVTRRWAREHPEWWAYALGVLAWLAMLPHMLSPSPLCYQATLGVEAKSWVLMVVAMMVPVVAQRLRLMAAQAYRRRRHLAMFDWLAGYLAVWTLAGVPLVVVRASEPGHHPAAPALVFAAAALLTSSRWQLRARWAHHGARPLAPVGLSAVASELREGARIGLRCVVTCGPWMVACALTGHALVAMVGCFAIAWVEQRSFRPPIRHLAVATWLLAMHAGWTALRSGA